MINMVESTDSALSRLSIRCACTSLYGIKDEYSKVFVLECRV